MTDRVVRAVLFDLDDTIVPQAPWLAGAWSAVAAVAASHGVDEDAFLGDLLRFAGEGSARGGIIDRAVAASGADVPVAPLVEAFRSFRLERLACFPGADRAVERVRSRVPVGLVSDGDPGIQRAKLRSAGLSEAFDVVVLSDELGREHRKPDPAPYLAALAGLGLEPDEVAFVGDRPGTDLVGARRLGMLAVRVLTGEYRDLPDEVAPDGTFADLASAVDHLLGLLGPAR